MRLIKLVYLTIVQLVKQVWMFPRSFSQAIKQKRQRKVLKELEAERLDRICNPSKYLKEVNPADLSEK